MNQAPNTCKIRACTQDIFLMLRLIQSTMVSKMTKQAATMGLSSTQMLILYELYEQPNMTLQTLCNQLDLPKSTLSRIIDNLVEKGYVNRQIPTTNRRIVQLSLNEAAINKATSDSNSSCLMAKQHLLDKLDPEKKQGILDALNDLHQALKDQ